MPESYPPPRDERMEQVSLARGKFIEEKYGFLFGEEEMGDPSREFTPEELTTILMAYESLLAREGLLKGRGE